MPSLKPEEIAAYIGAAAWAPQIITWIYKWIVKTTLRIVPDRIAEIGFTNFGPIFNVRMAFFVENRDLIIDEIELVLRHQDGETRNFRWAQLGETFSEITDSAGNRQIVTRDQTPIAVKVVTASLLEKTVRFQEPRYHEADKPATARLVAHFGYLKQRNPLSYVPDTLACKEYFDTVELRQKWFWWKPGRYEVTLQPKSPQKFNLAPSSFAFELQDIDIDNLRRNIPMIETEVRNIISSNLPNSTQGQLFWHWANVSIRRPGDA